MSQAKHIADAESEFVIVGVTPDFCKVGSSPIPFDITQVLAPEKSSYAKTVFARDEKVLTVGSITKGVKGNEGKGVKSEVSGQSGHNLVIEGSPSVFVEGKPVARHNDQVLMNCKV
jgi:hypothetical protein